MKQQGTYQVEIGNETKQEYGGIDVMIYSNANINYYRGMIQDIQKNPQLETTYTKGAIVFCSITIGNKIEIETNAVIAKVPVEI